MRLRKLKLTDISRMLEWMRDEEVSKYLTIDPNDASEEHAEKFIRTSWEDKKNIHLAIADSNDIYLGTVSLKQIDMLARKAEYAISLHRDSMGTGVAHFATKEILKIAFHERGLKKVYLNVVSENTRAVRFYEKYGFILEGEFKAHIFIKGEVYDLRWYALFTPRQNGNVELI